jgi:carboxypeptidase Q
MPDVNSAHASAPENFVDSWLRASTVANPAFRNSPIRTRARKEQESGMKNTVLTLALIAYSHVALIHSSPVTAARQQSGLQEWIQQAAPNVQMIIESGKRGNNSYQKLQELCDDIGHRLSGSPQLEKAIAWAAETMRRDGHENVVIDPVVVRKWVRGEESLGVVSPREMPLSMMGLGGSIGTPPEGITADVIVVSSKEELDALPEDQVKGRIVVFNVVMPPWSETEGSGYGKVVAYRSNGARWAAEKGGVAVLVRSATARSLDSPHTGAMRYSGGSAVKEIPAASITIEGATLLARWQARGITPRVCLKMEAADAGEAMSGNVLAEYVGRELPDEYVVIGGHIDSWDVGTGAHDDGAGCVAAMEALSLLRRAGMQPRRTIRVVLFTNEENGTAGAQAYRFHHGEEKHFAAIESDSGGFAPQGISVEMSDPAKQDAAAGQMQQMISLLKPLGANEVDTGSSGTDIEPLLDLGSACMGLSVDGRYYFDTHHTHADTVDKVNPDQLTDCSITMAVTAWLLAEMPFQIGDVAKGK